MNTSVAPYRFHAFERSLFSGKLRPALRYKQLWYEERRANVREIIERTGLGFIPILVTPEDETWQDTSEILDRLEARYPEPPLFPRTPFARMAAYLVELYADEFAFVAAMHYRWGTPEGEAEARKAFVAMTGVKAFGEGAGDQMVKARYAVGATPETGPAIEEHTHAWLGAMSAHLAEHPYMLGARMSLADCALMGPIYAHLYNDVTSRPMLFAEFRQIVAWIERCNYPGADTQGEWLDDASLASALQPFFRATGADAAPIIAASVRDYEAWADENPEARKEPPRGVGHTDADLRGTPFRCVTRSYTLWMLQRVLDAWAELASAERTPVEAALAGSGWEGLLCYDPRHRLVKRNYKLVEAT